MASRRKKKGGHGSPANQPLDRGTLTAALAVVRESSTQGLQAVLDALLQDPEFKSFADECKAKIDPVKPVIPGMTREQTRALAWHLSGGSVVHAHIAELALVVGALLGARRV